MAEPFPARYVVLSTGVSGLAIEETATETREAIAKFIEVCVRYSTDANGGDPERDGADPIFPGRHNAVLCDTSATDVHKHGTTFNGCSISSVSKDLPEGIDPFPPVVIVYAGGDFSPYAEKHGCDPVVVIIDNGTKDGTEHDEWLDGIRQIAAGFPADHPAAVELLDFIDQEA